MKRYYWILLSLFLIISSCNNHSGRIDPTRIDSDKELQDYLCYGWNTWNNPNLLSHVLLPEGLELKLSFWLNYNRGGHSYMDESYVANPKHNFPTEVIPIAHTYDGQYTELRIRWKGMTALIQSASHHDDLYILYTPEKLPDNPHIMVLEAGMLYNYEGVLRKSGNTLQADMSTRSYSVGSTQQDTLIPLPVSGPYLTFKSSGQTAFFTGEKRSLEYIQSHIERRKREFNENISRYGEQEEVYYAMKNLLAWNLIYDQFNERAITPISRLWNEKWGDWSFFGWDSYFTAAMYATDNKYHAFSNAIAITDEISADGFLPDYSVTTSDTGISSLSQPPVGSLICKLIYEKYPEKWFLEEVYQNLLTWNRWWPENKDIRGFLSRNSEDKGKQMASAELMSLYIADCQSLAFIAQELGKPKEHEELIQRAEKYSERLADLWNEEAGMYMNKNLSNNVFSQSLSPAALYPLLTGIPSPEQANRMVNEYMLNENQLKNEYIAHLTGEMDSLQNNHPYQNERMLGPANFLAYLGLRNYKLPAAQRLLALKSREILLKEWQNNLSLYENFESVPDAKVEFENCDRFYSRGGLLALIVLMEEDYWKNQEPDIP